MATLDTINIKNEVLNTIIKSYSILKEVYLLRLENADPSSWESQAVVAIAKNALCTGDGLSYVKKQLEIMRSKSQITEEEVENLLAVIDYENPQKFIEKAMEIIISKRNENPLAIGIADQLSGYEPQLRSNNLPVLKINIEQ